MASQTGHSPGQEAGLKWNVEIPPPLPRTESVEPPPKPEPIEFTVLASRTKRVHVTEAAEMPDLPRVEGIINLTIQRVVDPGLPDPPPPLPALPPDDPAVLARMAEWREIHRGVDLCFLSASVVDGKRTLLRIYPNGKADEVAVAWSNLNFMYLAYNGGYRVHHADGTFHDVGILLGISPVNAETARQVAARAGREYKAPEIPQLPDVETAGPSFVLIEGEAEGPAADILEQLHDLFRVSGEAMKERYLSREKQRAERKAYLLANPGKPDDVTIRVWRRTRNQ